MHEPINYPPILMGDERTQIQQLRSYLINVCESVNRNLEGIGGNDLTDRERAAVQGVIQTGGGLDDFGSLRDMVVRLAEYVKKIQDQAQGSSITREIESGRFGLFVRTTTVSLPADMDGHEKTEQIAAALNRMKADGLTLKSCVYAGELREGVTGIAIGQDVVTYAEDGTETFNPGNALIEITDGGDVNILGALRGGYAETQETNLNSITEDGKYWINISGMSNRPSGVDSGDFLLEVFSTSGNIIQRLIRAGSFFVRRNTGTWSAWFKYTGTSV